ncbi:MAG TPA: hypothetical protein VHT52_12445 [Stellaceae bacterium]|jgi:hypothetical protein|nr:hypothetical protein [Stellaceae bacterium]
MDNSDAPLAQLLFSNGPAPDRADKMGLYGWLIGDWVIDAVMHTADGDTQARQGEISFAWVLEGRAIQDVWILPDFFYGTTLRVYDPGIDAWHILWSDPLRQFYNQQIGRAHGTDIVQLGKSDDGTDTRWSFSKINADSFRWLGEFSTDGGATWRLRAEFQCRRKA